VKPHHSARIQRGAGHEEREHRKDRHRKHKRRPCGNPPAVPANVALTFRKIQGKGRRRYSGRVKWDVVTLDEGGHGTEIKAYDVRLRVVTSAGVVLDAEDLKPRLRYHRKDSPDRIRIDEATNPSGSTGRYVTRKAHGRIAGDTFEVRGCSPQLEYNGSFTVGTVVNSTTLEANIGASGIADCRNPGVMIDDDDRLHVVTDVLPRPKRWHWQAAARAIDHHGCEGSWSAWTSVARPDTNDRPASPLDVRLRKSHDRIVVTWDDPTEDFDLSGTVSGTSGTATLTGSGTKFTYEIEEGSDIRVGGNVYRVKRITSDTALTLRSNLSTSPSASVFYLVEEDSDVHRYRAQIALLADVDVGQTPDLWDQVYDQQKTKKNRVAFKIVDDDEDELFYARVCSISDEPHRSRNVPATLGGNSDPDANGDAIGIIRDVFVKTFTVDGEVEAKAYAAPWRAHRDVRIKRIKATAGRHDGGTHPDDGAPVGADLKAQIYKADTTLSSETAILSTGDIIKIDAGTHKDAAGGTDGDYNTRNIDENEILYVDVTQVGSTSPGSDLAISVFMIPR
jgi:hypothetical protein